MAQLSEKQLVQAACSRHEGETPETLLSFKVYPTKVAIILSDGRKFEYGVSDLVAWVKGKAKAEAKAKGGEEK